jgi:uracil permease
MSRPEYIYSIDERPPPHYMLVYGLQWAVIMFPALVVLAALCAEALELGAAEEVRFLQVTLLTSGLFTVVQTLAGHRYPLFDGPAAALLLCFVLLAPYGLEVIQGATAAGGALLMLLVLSRQLRRLLKLFTNKVIGVILMMVALTIAPHLQVQLIGETPAHPQGEVLVFGIALGLILFIAALAHWLKGFWKTINLLIGIAAGTAVFGLLGRVSAGGVASAGWLSTPAPLVPGSPEFFWPALISYGAAYLAVVVNSVGSLQGIAAVTDPDRLPSSTERGIFLNGMAGVVCGLVGTVGLVSYSTSPGIVLMNRVASRFALTCCGAVFVLAALAPKLSALMAAIPDPVVASALCVGLGGQVGVGINEVSKDGLASRDYFVVGIPVLVGTMIAFMPREFLSGLAGPLQVLLGNGLVAGIVLVLLFEHVLFRKRGEPEKASWGAVRKGVDR